MYKVIRKFRDEISRDIYIKGDSYSHEDDNRVAFLIGEGFLEEKSKQPPKEDDGKENNEGKQEYPINTGGSWYELSNGEKVQGKEEAENAQAELESGE